MVVSLTKGSSLSLTKSDGSALSKVLVGLGWDEAKGGLFGGSIDLDASAILLGGDKRVLDTVWYGGLNSKDGSVHHNGDNLTGAGDGDDEQIVIDLARVDAQVQSIVIVITSYSRHSFSKISNVFARVADISGAENELVRYNLADAGNRTAQIVAKLTRQGSGWAFTAIGNPADGRTAKDVVADAQAAV